MLLSLISGALPLRCLRPVATAVQALLITLCLAMVACERSPATGPASSTKRDTVILTTTAQIADAVRGVLGSPLPPGVTVSSLLGEGVDPHTYKLTRSDAVALHSASVVLLSGLHLEGKMTEMLAELQRSGKPVLDVGSMLPHKDLLVPVGSQGEHDPHFWMDPILFASGTAAIEQGLKTAGVAIDPAKAAAYRDQLTALDGWAQSSLGSIPKASRRLITSHDAFGYLGHRYGLKVEGIQGISTESEAGVRDIERLVDALVTSKIPAVFVESSVSSRAINALVAGAEARGHTVVIGGELFSDAMGPPGTYQGTYIGMMRHNVESITRALGGVIAAWPAGLPAATTGGTP